MKKTLLKLAVLSSMSFISVQAFAAGSLCTLPAAPAGSAYINAYNTGRVIPPLAGPATTVCNARTNFGTLARDYGAGCVVSNCAITAIANDTSSPLPGYAIVNQATRVIPAVTGGATSIGSLVENIWRKPAATAPVTPTPMCIIGTRVLMTNVDHDTGTAGTQLFQVNDIARGGYSASGSVGVGYFIQAVNASPLYRAGRTFTSVQHRPYSYNGSIAARQNNALGHLDLPIIGGSATTAINSNIQQAQVNSNWVDFTTKVFFLNFDGATSAVSAMHYVQFPCNSDSAATINSTWVKTGAIRLRQTGQEGQSLKEISINGFAPPGAVVP